MGVMIHRDGHGNIRDPPWNLIGGLCVFHQKKAPQCAKREEKQRKQIASLIFFCLIARRGDLDVQLVPRGVIFFSGKKLRCLQKK